MRHTVFARLGTAALASAAGIVLATHIAQAAMLAGLKDGNTIVWIDTDTKKVTGSVPLDGGASLVGFDVRPADSKLYGVTPDGAIVTIDAKTGKLEKKSQLSEKLPAGATVSIDFNPVADRMRILTSTGMSLRVNVDDGKATVDGALKYAETDAMKGKAPMVTAAAYSNSFAGTKETALYDIDTAAGTLTKQAPPNDGILTTIGSLGIKIDGPIAFDVWSDGKGMNVGWLLAGGTLHTVDLSTGTAKGVGSITGLTGKITDIAILPGT
jgi:DNA-binding beta-propeller fold protein YncE